MTDVLQKILENQPSSVYPEVPLQPPDKTQQEWGNIHSPETVKHKYNSVQTSM